MHLGLLNLSQSYGKTAPYTHQVQNWIHHLLHGILLLCFPCVCEWDHYLTCYSRHKLSVTLTSSFLIHTPTHHELLSSLLCLCFLYKIYCCRPRAGPSFHLRPASLPPWLSVHHPLWCWVIYQSSSLSQFKYFKDCLPPSSSGSSPNLAWFSKPIWQQPPYLVLFLPNFILYSILQPTWTLTCLFHTFALLSKCSSLYLILAPGPTGLSSFITSFYPF